MAWLAIIIAGLGEVFGVAMMNRWQEKRTLSTIIFLIVSFGLSLMLLSFADWYWYFRWCDNRNVILWRIKRMETYYVHLYDFICSNRFKTYFIKTYIYYSTFKHFSYIICNIIDLLLNIRRKREFHESF